MQINVGIIGLGTVGCGTYEVLRRNAELIAQRAGGAIRVRRIATANPHKARPVEFDANLVSSDVDALLSDPEIHIVAELVGGVEPAREYVLRAIANGKSVVTANKELIAKCGTDIMTAAEKAGVDFLFEGSVGAGIPLIKPLRESLAGNRVHQLIGIVNGTTNFILSAMTRDGRDFDDVLSEAQKLGYAETDPTADLDGFDAAYKLAILADVAFGTRVTQDDIYREGIRKIDARDIEYAKELGYVIKLIALGKHHANGELELRVHPAFLPQTHPLASVSDAFNAVLIEGDAVGEVMFYGRGAGMEPTGSAVAGDIIEAARNIRVRATGLARHEPLHQTRILDFAEVETRFCLRMQVDDKPGVLARIAAIFGECGVSLESIVQKQTEDGEAEIFWMTHTAKTRAVGAALSQFEELEIVREVSSVLRVEGA
jgi:homoserine dehydrogenase